jgi:hypothetical protein
VRTYAPVAQRAIGVAFAAERADLLAVLKLVLVSAVVMGLSHTIAKERIFAPLRERLGGTDTWAGYLVSCPYCVSHWIAFLLVPLTALHPIELAVHWGSLTRVFEWFLASILVTVIAAFLRVAFWWMDETQALVRKEKTRVEKVNQKLDRDLDSDDSDLPAPH